MSLLKPIKITSRTRYKIKNQKFIDKLFEEMPEEITICGIKFHLNTATLKPCYCYSEGFGTGFLSRYNTSFWIGFYQHIVEVNCTTAEDWFSLTFMEGKDMENLNHEEKQCAKRVISILKKLNRYNYIELPKEKEKTKNANKNS